MKIFTITVSFVLFLSVFAFPQNKKIDLNGKHTIGLNIGLSNQTTNVTVDVPDVSSDMNFQASLAYNYWFSEELSVEANAGYIASSVSTSVSVFNIQQKTSHITPFYFGVKYSPLALKVSENIRPFAAVLAGGVTGSGTDNKINLLSVTTESYTETVFSFKTSIGADGLISDFFKLGMSADYLYMPDFSRSIGTRKNYSGFNLSVNLGFML